MIFDEKDPVIFQKKVKKKYKSVEVPRPLAPLADTHGHLYSFFEKTPEEVLPRTVRSGVELLVTLADPIDDRLDLASVPQQLRAWATAAQALNPNFNLRYLVGVHPYGAARYTSEVDARIRAAITADPWAVGVGEIGLDYHFDTEDGVDPAGHELQIECMKRQLQIALDLNVPVELHLRHDAADEARTSHEDAFRVLKELGVPKAGCVLHCFGENKGTMERFVALGCSIAYGGAATFKRNEEVREAFAATPLDRVLFETDCPYMAPEPLRGVECEPAMVAITANLLIEDRAERTGEDPEDIARAAWENSKRLFLP